MLLLNIVGVLSHFVLFTMIGLSPYSINTSAYLNCGTRVDESDLHYYETLLKILNNYWLLISANIALNNWTQYNFAVGKQVKLKIKNEKKILKETFGK